MLGGCPSIEKLELLLREDNARLAAHVGKCKGCQGVLALLVGQTPDPVESEDCARAELLIVARQTAPLAPAAEDVLVAHIAECEACRELSDFSGD